MRAAMASVLLAAAIAAAGGVARAGSELPRHTGMYPKQGAPLAMVASDVDVVVHGAIVEVSVTQSFRNDTDQATEATYIFPLPADAAVSAMSMTLGARTIHAAIATRGDARKRYEDAVSAGVGATVLEQERPDVFTQTVSAIPAHGTVAVTLRYDATAAYHDGTWALAVPLVVAPRYVPGTASGRPTTGAGSRPDTDRSPDGSRVTPPSGPDAGGPTHVAFHFADAVDDVASPTHELAAHGGGYALTDAHSDHDAVIRWRAHDPARGWSEPGATSSDGGYAAVLVEAPPAVARAAGSKLDVTLVLDRSAASLGDAEAVAHPLVHALAGALGAHDSLAIAGSDHIARQAAPGALAELERVWARPAGAFDLTVVLRDLREQRAKAGGSAAGAAIVLVTGGLVSDDQAAIAAAQAVGAPIHVIGVGSAPNRALLAAIAAASGGTVRIASPDDDLAAFAKDALADAAAPPALLTVNWGALSASEVVPAALPRLGAGQARLVVARVKASRSANARAAGDVFAIAELPAEKAVAGETSALGPLARRWARDRLDELLASPNPDAKVVEAFALRYGLVSPYTSMVAIGDEVVDKGGVKHSVSVPVSVPAGMRWQAVDAQDRVATEKSGEGDVSGKAPDGAPVKTVKEDGERGDGKGGKPAKDTDHTRREHDESEHHGTRDTTGTATSDAKKNAPPAEPEPPPPHQRKQPVADDGDDDADGRGNGDGDDEAKSATKSKRHEHAATSGADAPDLESSPGATVPAPKEEAAADEATTDTGELVVVKRSGYSDRGWGAHVDLGGGVVATRGTVDGLGALAVGVDRGVGGRSALSIEGALWLAGSDVQGQLAAGVTRALWRVLASAEVGVHLGDGVGPVVDLAARYLVVPHVGVVLRYDGSLLFDRGSSDLDHAFTLGLEWRF
jgi:Ca-activated chloride channel family protein|nr:VIT domain-containing protein [Kofleriaceae bacterium]